MLVRDLLQELNGVKGLRSEPKDSAIAKFKANGGTVTGGAFSTVWMHPRWNYVWKTFPHNQAYLQYLEYAAKHPQNPNFPRIFKMKKVIPPYARPNTAPFLWAVKMEKLKPLSAKNWEMVDAARGLLLGFEFNLTMATFKQKYGDVGMNIMRTIQLLEDARGKQKPQALDDLHKQENFMERADGTVVITDPWWTNQKLPQPTHQLAGGTLDQLGEGLVGVKKYKQEPNGEMLQNFVNAGGTYTTAGNFSVVLMHPNWDYVWKTFIDDPGYLHFLSMVKKNPTNPHYPRIFKVKKIVPPYRRNVSYPFLWVVKMEKLLPISGANWKIVEHCLSVINFGMSQERFNDLHPTSGDLLGTIYGITRNRGGGILDLERRNFMQRQDGTIVVADPLWDEAGVQKSDRPKTKTMVDGGELPPGA